MIYDFKKIDKKWQKKWETEGTFFAKEDPSLKKWYGLIEFPYPSGQGLHVGHPRSYTALDIIARKKRLEGYNVLYPIGFDAFGLPAENYAIKNHIHPKITTEKNVNHFREQLKALGFSFDWSREINTTDPNYYKWTQWIFIQLYKHGLAYKTTMPINYCTGCKVGLANEEVVNGVCERCGSEVVQKEKSQWMLKITEYAQRLIDDLEEVDFLDKIKTQQINWIGRSEGAEVKFKIANSNKELNDNYVEIGGNKVLKSAAIYGANASGKSNLFKILTLVVLMLRSSNSVDINAKLPLIPFKLDKGSVNKPSEFEIKFILDETRYVYGFIADKDKIYDEYLYYYPNGRETKIFDRTNINEYSYTQKDEKILREIEAKNAQNKFFLATATNWNFDKTKAAYNFLTNGIGTCNNLEILKNMAYKMYETNPDYLKYFAIDFLQKADFNIEDYQISQIDVPGEFLTAIPEFITKTLPDKSKAYQVLFKHKNSDNYLSIDEESLGTQMIFAFIPFLADSLKNKKVLIIDELDKSLHPFLVQYIVEIFNDAEINKNGSQLIFNTHDTNLLDLNILRRDQIWFTEKNSETGESDLYSLSDFSVRKQENVEKGYMLGRYGAVPFIKNDFNLWEEE